MEQAYAHSNLGTLAAGARRRRRRAVAHSPHRRGQAAGLVAAATQETRAGKRSWRAASRGSPRCWSAAASSRRRATQYEASRDVLAASSPRWRPTTPATASSSASGTASWVKRSRASAASTRRCASTSVGLALQRELQELDPANADWRREAAVSHRRLGSALARRRPGGGIAPPAAGGEDPRRAALSGRHFQQRAPPRSRPRAVWTSAAACWRAARRGRLPAEERAALAALLPAAGGESEDRPRRLLESEVRLALGEALPRRRPRRRGTRRMGAGRGGACSRSPPAPRPAGARSARARAVAVGPAPRSPADGRPAAGGRLSGLGARRRSASLHSAANIQLRRE